MATDMQKLIGTSEDDDDEEMDMDVKEEDDGNVEKMEKQIASQTLNGVDGRVGMGGNYSQFQTPIQELVSTPGGGSRRSRPLEEKERTKLRERHRRAITARILGGLRRHGNYNLRVRADINDVIAALAREAGWVVLPDGTTFPSRTQGSRSLGSSSSTAASSSAHMATQQNSPPALRGARPQNLEIVGDGTHSETRLPIGNSLDAINTKEIASIPAKLPERDFTGTPYVPVYVMLPLGAINMKSEIADPDGLLKHLKALRSINVDGVKIDCWWGIVEMHTPQEYNWNGYRRLFQMVRDLDLKLQVVMSFHECGGNVGDDVCIPLPHWVAEVGRSDLGIFFTDREGRQNPECLSWGVDRQRVLKGRTALEVYFDYMRSFRIEFADLFEGGVISMVDIGLGPCGELRYPSFPVKHGWRYPGVGEFQCYDKHLLKSLKMAAEIRGHPFWARPPDNVGSYNSQPHETGFFCDGGDYDSFYGKFFLKWYSQILVDHADRVLALAKLAFEGTCVAAKLSGIPWWYKTPCHAAELTAGFYNPRNRDGYANITSVLKKHGATLNFTSGELHMLNPHEEITGALADPDGLVWQVMNAAWDNDVPIARENALPCYDRAGYNKILDDAKLLNDPDGRHVSSFIYLRLSSTLMERQNLMEFERFVKRMHGEAVLDHHV